MSDAKDALNDWRSSGRQVWRRVSVAQDVVCIRVGMRVDDQPYMVIEAQRRLERGPSKGQWTGSLASGAIWTREQYIAVLEAVLHGGFLAGFLNVRDVRELLNHADQWVEPDPDVRAE